MRKMCGFHGQGWLAAVLLSGIFALRGEASPGLHSPHTPPDMVAQSDVVVIATLKGVKEVPGDQGFTTMEGDLVVKDTLKGPIQSTLRMRWTATAHSGYLFKNGTAGIWCVRIWKHTGHVYPWVPDESTFRGLKELDTFTRLAKPTTPRPAAPGAPRTIPPQGLTKPTQSQRPAP